MATEKRLIDANALIESGNEATMIDVFPDWLELPESVKEAVCKHGQFLKKLIQQLPTVDAVEVVRCKDCVWCEHGKRYEPYCNHPTDGMHDVQPDDFCSYGERKDND